LQLHQRYEIDCYLQRPASIIVQLAGILKAGAVSSVPVPEAVSSSYASTAPAPTLDTLMAVVENNKLQLQAIDLFPGDQWSKLRRDLVVSHARQLVLNGRYEDAAFTFMSAVPPACDDAVSAAEKGGLWQLALILAGRAGWKDGQIVKLCQSLVATLQSDTDICKKRTAAMLLVSSPVVGKSFKFCGWLALLACLPG
jgi:hypothetical protein